MKNILFLFSFLLIVGFVFAQLNLAPNQNYNLFNFGSASSSNPTVPLPSLYQLLSGSAIQDDDTDDNFIVQINNLRITKIVTSTSQSTNSGTIYAVRDVNWGCSYTQLGDSQQNSSCPLFLRRYILQKEITIKINDDTILLLRNRQKIKLTNLQIGDKINVYGFMDKDDYNIEALVVRKLSQLNRVPLPSLPFRNVPPAIENMPTVTVPLPPTLITSTLPQNQFPPRSLTSTRRGMWDGYIISIEIYPSYPSSEVNSSSLPIKYIPPLPTSSEIFKDKPQIFYYLKDKDFATREYQLIPQNPRAKMLIDKFKDSNILVRVEGFVFVKENSQTIQILANKIYETPKNAKIINLPENLPLQLAPLSTQ